MIGAGYEIPNMASTDAADYKARKEAFVSDLSGGSITEINLVTFVAPVRALLIRHISIPG